MTRTDCPTNTMQFISRPLRVRLGSKPPGDAMGIAARHRHHRTATPRKIRTRRTPSGPGALFGWLKASSGPTLAGRSNRDPRTCTASLPDLLKSPSMRLANKLFRSGSRSSWRFRDHRRPRHAGNLVRAHQGFIWGGLVRLPLGYHATWSWPNSICHIWKPAVRQRPQHERWSSASRLWAKGWLLYAFPTSARHGLEWWQFDVARIVIRAMQAISLAWNVVAPLLT
ncbi:MAG: hypothetical protein U0792_20115 [Gemmataceae bacterium]